MRTWRTAWITLQAGVLIARAWGVMQWRWWWVLAPTWVPIAAVLAVWVLMWVLVWLLMAINEFLEE